MQLHTMVASNLYNKIFRFNIIKYNIMKNIIHIDVNGDPPETTV